MKSGATTTGAVRMRAGAWRHAELLQLLLGYALVGRLSRRSQVTVIPVSPPVWRRWRLRLLLSVGLTAIGAAAIVSASIGGDGGLIVLGAVGIGAGGVVRYRAARVCWIGLRYRADEDHVIVSRVSARYAAEAQALFVASLHVH